MIKKLLMLTAVIEMSTGIALLLVPALLASILLGAELFTPAEFALAHVAGAALLSLSAVCWLARNKTANQAVITAILVYNTAVTAVLLHAGLRLDLVGIFLWPVVGLHAAFAGWCIACLQPFKAVLPR